MGTRWNLWIINDFCVTKTRTGSGIPFLYVEKIVSLKTQIDIKRYYISYGDIQDY